MSHYRAMFLHLRQNLFDHNALIANALQPRDFERQYLPQAKKRHFELPPHTLRPQNK
jgi:hypothetical protein